MTNTKLVAHVRSKLATAGLYPWWLGLQERDIIALCDGLEKQEAIALALSEKLAICSRLLTRKAERAEPSWWPEVKRKCGILLGEALEEATCYFAEPLLILQLAFPITKLGVREYCREREPLIRSLIAQESKQVWSIRLV